MRVSQKGHPFFRHGLCGRDFRRFDQFHTRFIIIYIPFPIVKFVFTFQDVTREFPKKNCIHLARILEDIQSDKRKEKEDVRHGGHPLEILFDCDWLTAGESLEARPF